MTSEKGPAFRILIGSVDLGRSRAVMWASLGFALVALGFGGVPGVAASGFFGGVFVLLFFATRYVRTEQSHCAFCDHTKANVSFLVAGPACSICEKCAPLPVEIVADREANGWITVAHSLPK